MILCYVTDRSAWHRESSGRSPATELLQRITWAAAAGVDWIQIREKDLDGRALVKLAREAIAAIERTSSARRANAKGERTQLIVNDRIDAAIAAGAAGVHLGFASVPVGQAVRWLRAGNAPQNFLIGASCHSLEEAGAAQKSGASYVFFGPVYKTPSKRQFGDPQGIERLRVVCRRVRIPVIAIGGITPGNALACVHAGAAGVAAVRTFQEARDAEQLADAVAGWRKLEPSRHLVKSLKLFRSGSIR